MVITQFLDSPVFFPKECATLATSSRRSSSLTARRHVGVRRRVLRANLDAVRLKQRKMKQNQLSRVNEEKLSEKEL